MGFLDVPTHPVTAASIAAKMDKGSVVVNVLDYGAKGDWNPYTLTGTDDTAAIKAALAATPQGGTLFFPGFGNSRKYLISSQIDITTYNVRLMGAPRDTYASAVRMNVTGGEVKTMFKVLAPGTVFENMGIEGGGGQITGVEVWGDSDGNCDARFSSVCFTRLFVGVRTRGRNITWNNECIFSISTEGIVIDGPDPVYHTGPNAATSQRGYKIDGNLFHGNGSAATQGSIHIMPAAKVKYAVIWNNSFDGGGKNTHVLAEGTSADPIQHLHITDNTHNDMNATAYNLTWVQNSKLNGADIAGTTTGATRSDTAITLSNCKWLNVSNVSGESIGRHGFKAVSSSYLWVSNVNFNTVGLDTGAVYDGFNVDSSNTVVQFDNLFVVTAPGWGFNGSPGNAPSMENSRFYSCTLGGTNSTTMYNRAMSGRNHYIEGAGGRKQDYASKPFDLTVAGGATTVATVASAANFSSFEVEVKIIGRNTAGNCYVKAVRYVRPEGGTPAYTTVGTDVIAGTIAVGFTTAGTAGVNVTATATGSDAFVTVHVTAYAGGGASTANLRGVTVTMA